MEEYIDILDSNGIPTGEVKPKSEVHEKGYFHNTAHVWIFNENKEILLQQRSLNKSICPGLWDVSAAGHVDAGERVEDAAIREVYEELGLKLQNKKLIKIGTNKIERYYSNNLIDNEFHNSFLYQTNTNIKSYIIDSIEVEAIKYVTIEDFIRLLNTADNNHFVKSNREYYLNVIKSISEF